MLAQHVLFRYWKETKACKADALSETDVFVSSTGSLKIMQGPSTVLSLAVWLVLAQLDVLRSWKETEAYKNDVYLLPTESR